MIKLYSADRLRTMASSVFEVAGSSTEEAKLIADHLVDANLAGHDSHGLIRLQTYLDWLAAGKVFANTPGTVVKSRGSMIVYDGEMGYGQVVAHRALALGITSAKEHGLSMVAIRNSSHLGRIGAWAELVAAAGLISFHWVNTTGAGMWVSAFNGMDRRLSANPVAAGAPVPGADPLILDFSTSTVAEGKVLVAKNKGLQVPPRALIDANGQPSTDPDALYAGGALLPFGEHKGYALGVFCEIFAGSLTGGTSTHPDNANADRLVNNMLSFIVDPEAVVEADVYGSDVKRLCDWIRSSRPITPERPVLLPGDIERNTRAQRLEDGIPLDALTVASIEEVALRVGKRLHLDDDLHRPG